ncbi:HIT family protein [Lactiplantibacillus mudanjiangensis]|uniref:HIT family protein [Lactobacillus pentosus] n=1 Tax=Lactiplantibacillus mudanjiangensis TaxID=1296538 RepID=A0A660EC56_9LACO|nr:HIT family protein [Lactobacillus pentosus] [Lactiplantibacillus mudanjiangensis]VDG24167.1 HIT family protein [Lactobacillus pentosus] [Lactiplantibacillus mudanjiangensis]VDG30151.1 HIT family protein [Lactobacillus pentosus] [Lactiplantibacillus mudanjiangensis]VDG30635.1 HIT family protein [Lactobacillus pentosus] [Lactiplantibacillus mudanjiangensis]
MKNCLICQRITAIQQHQNPWFVRELTSGYVVLADSQYFKGYTLFLAKAHVTELHLMTPAQKTRFLIEMSWVAEACALAFHADKMNIEMLGNGDAHAHWHLFPRHLGDTPKPGPVWWVDPAIMYADTATPNATELATAKAALNQALDHVLAKY